MEEQQYRTTEEARKQNRTRWLGRISSWKNSGLSASAWCRTQGVKYSALIFWRKRLTKHKLPHEGFVEIVDDGSTRGKVHAGAEVVLENIAIRLCHDFDSNTFTRCLQLLRGQRC